MSRDDMRVAADDAAEHRDEHDTSMPPSGEEVEYPATLGLALTTLAAKAEKARDRLLRTTADFENYRRRAKREGSENIARAEERVVLEFLPVLDNLERALAHCAGGESASETNSGNREAVALIDGIVMVKKHFEALLCGYGIESFDTVGQCFDPQRHEAIQQVASDEPINTIVNEIQRGYERQGRLVRPAMVVVSRGPNSSPTSASEIEVDSGELGPRGEDYKDSQDDIVVDDIELDES